MEPKEIVWNQHELIRVVEDVRARELTWHISYPSIRAGYFSQMVIWFIGVQQSSVVESPATSPTTILNFTDQVSLSGTHEVTVTTSAGTRVIICDDMRVV